MKNALAEVQSEGYVRFQSGETHVYHVGVGEVCPVCIKLDGTVYRGDFLVANFPDLQPTDTLHSRLRNETWCHASYSCRCTSEWTNFRECIVDYVVDVLENA